MTNQSTIKNIRSKIKSYNVKINRHLHNNGVLREGYRSICLSVIFIDSVVKGITCIFKRMQTHYQRKRSEQIC